MKKMLLMTPKIESCHSSDIGSLTYQEKALTTVCYNKKTPLKIVLDMIDGI